MSADNGIYILETVKGNGKEYRVEHLQAVENYLWDENLQVPEKSYKGGETDNPNIHIKNAREMWANCKVFTNKQDASLEADKLYNEIIESDFPIIEYGISTIKIDREF